MDNTLYFVRSTSYNNQKVPLNPPPSTSSRPGQALKGSKSPESHHTQQTQRNAPAAQHPKRPRAAAHHVHRVRGDVERHDAAQVRGGAPASCGGATTQDAPRTTLRAERAVMAPEVKAEGGPEGGGCGLAHGGAEKWCCGAGVGH